MKKLTILFVLLFVLVALYLFVVVLGFMPNNNGKTLPENKAEVVEYFSEEMQNKFVTEVAQPIEGFEPQMFREVYPGLVAQDFDEVEALLGNYEVQNGEIAFVLDQSQPEHSAARAISPQGMYTLLMNVSDRLNTPTETKTDIDALLAALENKETGNTQTEATVTAGLNERVGALDVFITPLEVLEDSRCPEGAQCIQAGTVRVRTQIESGLGTSTMNITLSGDPTTTEAEEISLIKVSPKAVLGTEIAGEDYSFTFLIEKR